MILDFDYTLFDTLKLKEAIREEFNKYGVSYELFDQTREESKNGQRDWRPRIQFAILRSHGIKNISAIEEGFEKIVASAQNFLYQDTMPFFEKAKAGHSFFLVTYGEDEFQNAKVDGCSILKKYFDKIIVTQNIYKDKEAADFAAGEPAVFIEDNPAALAAAKKLAPQITTVRMNRGMGRYINEVSGEGIDFEVRELMEVKRVIPKLF